MVHANRSQGRDSSSAKSTPKTYSTLHVHFENMQKKESFRKGFCTLRDKHKQNKKYEKSGVSFQKHVGNARVCFATVLLLCLLYF